MRSRCWLPAQRPRAGEESKMTSWLARKELRNARHTDRDPEQAPLVAIGHVHDLARKSAEITPPLHVGDPGRWQLHQELDVSRRRDAPDVSIAVLGGIHVATGVDAHAVDASREVAARPADAAVARTGAVQRILTSGAFLRSDAHDGQARQRS